MRLLIFILLTNMILHASFMRWHGDYEAAHRVALQLNKPLLVLLLKKNDINSKNVLVDSFMNQEYIEYINNSFVPVLVTKGQKNSYPIELLYTLEYPAIFFLDKHELYLCDSISGIITPKQLSSHLKGCFF